ncbi:MAG: GtrA family protein [Christensenellales bacterium]
MIQTLQTHLYRLCQRLTRFLCGHEDLQKTETLFQFAKFGLVGITNTLLSYVLNIAVLYLLEPFALSWDYIAGNVVAFVLSVLWSFYWNRRFVFQKEKTTLRTELLMLLKTYAAYALTGILLNNLLSWLWIEHFGISKYVAPLINLVISVPLNFVINKFWTFS